MKTSIFVKRSVIIAIALAALVMPTFALSSTGTLSLSGSVAAVTTITVTPDANASALPVGVATTNLQIATVVELSNSKAGYTVTLSSANGATLKETSGTDSQAYTLTYGSNPVTFTGSTATLTTSTTRSATAAGSSNILYISFPAAFLNADSYTDSLTFTITSP
ncbi:MAG TPA: hypothetical protein VMV83_10760 [Rectinemataceae bacterium]|nr:hypothetical protein [Rectinemataceae bacterium]